MTRLRVINLGLPKTGTTTLTDALRRAGLAVADWRIHAAQTAREDIADQHVGKIMYTDYYDSGDPLARLDEFDFINEMSAVRNDRSLWPQTDWGLLSAIQKHHPSVKFLLSHRDPAKTANSMMRWNNLGRRRLPNADIPGLPRGFGTDEAQLARWLEGHFSFVRRVFQGHDNFLEFDIEDDDARDRIAAYLGIDLPWWGKSNKGKPAKTEGE